MIWFSHFAFRFNVRHYIKADKTRVMDYVNRLDAFNGPEVGEIAVGNELYEEAFCIFKKFDLHVDAMKVGRCRLTPSKPKLKAPRSEHLKLRYD